MRKQLKIIHWVHASFVFLLLATGIALYFSGLPFISKKIARDIHIILAIGYLLFLLYSIFPSVKYMLILKKAGLKRLHILIMYFFAAIWFFSGMILWLNTPSLLEYRISALFLHDWLSMIIVPWVMLHIFWKLLKRRLAHKALVQTAGKIMSRREFLGLCVSAFLFLSFGALLKWFKPFLTEEQTSMNLDKRRGYFRIYTVTTGIPAFDEKTWKLTVDGLVELPQQFSLTDLKAMPRRNMVRDFHCVTGWSVLGVEWSGTPFSHLAGLVKPKANGTYVKMYSADGAYTETYKIEQLMNQDVLLVFELDGKPLIPNQGAPCRLFHPEMFGYKSIKWVDRIEFVGERELGYWEALEHYELNGYIEAT